MSKEYASDLLILLCESSKSQNRFLIILFFVLVFQDFIDICSINSHMTTLIH